MEKIGLNELRDMFRDFFVSKGHYAGGSAPLIPRNDKSLLIINSGMAPLKPYFAGVETPPSKRMTTCQKCIRTNDIENVGKTARHGTFFEMLGNFSFGDYFKNESLHWGWEFITEWLHMPTDKLWATIYEDDDQAFEIWKSIGMPEEKIVRLGKDDNFWEIGLGPCGPCSEIYFDRGEEYGCGSPNCKPGCDCDRYMEFWNHVFTQFSREEDGSYSNLAHPNIDTGMGLERLACLMQGVDSIYDVDTVRHILDSITELAGVEYQAGNHKIDVSVRIITDHLRSMVFMIGDGVLPSNEGRGYILRRLIRRAARHGRLLGITEENFLSSKADKVIEISGGAYPELVEKQDYIKKIIRIEEEQFAKTLDKGISILEGYMADMKEASSTELAGDLAFKLYDTYGFPVEVTAEILEENDMTLDMDGFNENMQLQKDRARAGRRSTEEEAWRDASEYSNLPATVFTGYENESGDAVVQYVGDYDKDRKFVILDTTPFYATSGGQVYDTGIISTENDSVKVVDVVKENGIFLHIIDADDAGAVMHFKVGDSVKADIDVARRHRVSRGHSATHLVQQALRDVLGDHVMQAGSYVDDKYLRFDFNHFQAMTADEIKKVEDIVNEKIDMFLPIAMQEMPIEEAKKLGAMALFGEKYGDIVRVVSMGDYSVEFCGGTHLANTGLVGGIKITSEYGVASGVRRIEAITGSAIVNYLADKENLISETAAALKSNPSDIARRAVQLVADNKELENTIKSLKSDEISGALDDIIAGAKIIGDAKLIAKRFDDTDVDQLRNISDAVKGKVDSVVMVFAAVNDGKVTFITSVSDDLVGKGYHAGKIIKEVAAAAGGGGGGKANMAQAGAKDASKIEDAFAKAEEVLAR
ncbi:MAG: alanine--tRNA ligase [Clostridiales bacterium]|nr:alanine--tRNA ligase [Candidatus Crickella merdequi]